MRAIRPRPAAPPHPPTPRLASTCPTRTRCAARARQMGCAHSLAKRDAHHSDFSPSSPGVAEQASSSASADNNRPTHSTLTLIPASARRAQPTTKIAWRFLPKTAPLSSGVAEGKPSGRAPTRPDASRGGARRTPRPPIAQGVERGASEPDRVQVLRAGASSAFQPRAVDRSGADSSPPPPHCPPTCSASCL